MVYRTLVVEPRDHSIVLTINRPESRNAINPEVMREMIQALDKARLDPDVRTVIVTGAGEKAFCAGGDLAGGSGGGALDQHFERALVSELFTTMRALGKPVIARVNGLALGGGFGLMLACDLVVAADTAEVGTPEVNIGLWPFIITAAIQRNLPPKIALELMMLGKRVSAAEGLRWGFINRVVPATELDSAVAVLAGELASKSPVVLRLGKDSFYAAEDLDFPSALKFLEAQLTIGLSAEDALEGVQAFIQKRLPQWKGR